MAAAAADGWEHGEVFGGMELMGPAARDMSKEAGHRVEHGGGGGGGGTCLHRNGATIAAVVGGGGWWWAS
jgi:hypothetical protein